MEINNQTNQKLLVVGMADSPHLQNWLSGIAELGMFKKILVFPTTSIVDIRSKFGKNSRVKNAIPFSGSRVFQLFGSGLDYLFRNRWRNSVLRMVILLRRPSVIHVHEIQHGGYFFEWPKLLRARSRPPLLCSTWGSDLIYYGNIPSHEERLRDFLSKVDVLLAERVSEEKIARSLGFTKKFIGAMYTTVGASSSAIKLTAPSGRKLIVVKGYQDIHGRALNALHVISSMSNLLEGYDVMVISASQSVSLEVERLSVSKNLSIQSLPKIPNSEVINLLRKARIFIGLSVSDGLPAMMVEAMQSGAFPIQSINSGAPEFIQHGVSGFIVDPWDFEGIRDCLESALRDANLVDNAVAINAEVLNKKYARQVGLKNLRDLYNWQLELITMEGKD